MLFPKMLLFTVIFLLPISCSESEDESPVSCQDSTPSVQILSTSDTPCGETTGRIEVTGNGGTGNLMYSIDGVNFQSSRVFENLESGKYQIEVQDENNCLSTASTTLVSGISLANDIENLIQGTCAVSGCHVTGEQAPDLSIRDNIISASTRIKTQLNSNSMPPADSGMDGLNDDEIQKVICWVNEGAPDN